MLANVFQSNISQLQHFLKCDFAVSGIVPFLFGLSLLLSAFFPLIYSIWSLDEWRIGKTNFNLPTDWDSRYCKLNVELNELNSGIFLNLDNYADASTIWLGSHFIEIRIVFSGQTTKLCYWIAHFNAHTCESWCLKCLNVHTCCVFSGTFIYIYAYLFVCKM